MVTEFNLSKEKFDTVNISQKETDGIWLGKDIKEFIKRLKEEISMECRERYLKSDGVMCEEGDICNNCKKQIKRIDKLAGDDLI